MTITEVSVDRTNEYLKNVGFTFRQHGGLGGHYFSAKDLEAHNWLRVDDPFLWENLKNNSGVEVTIDGMPVPRIAAMSLPVDLIAAVEVYRRIRPIEFSGHGTLVLIWTYPPRR